MNHLEQYEAAYHKESTELSARHAVLSESVDDVHELVRLVRSFEIRRNPVMHGGFTLLTWATLFMVCIGFGAIGHAQEVKTVSPEQVQTWKALQHEPMIEQVRAAWVIPAKFQEPDNPPQRCVCCCQWPECGGRWCCRINDCEKNGWVPAGRTWKPRAK